MKAIFCTLASILLDEQLVGEFDQDGKIVTFKFKVSDRDSILIID